MPILRVKQDLSPLCYNTPVITDIKATVERATLGSGGDGGVRTGRNCGGYGAQDEVVGEFAS